MDWIDLAEDSDGCGALVNAVMNFGVPKNADCFLNSVELLTYEKGPCCVGLGIVSCCRVVSCRVVLCRVVSACVFVFP
jgi:hypothetical protein